MKMELGDGESYLTLDINNRDAFGYYHLDNIALDVGLNYMLDGQRMLRLHGGVRTAAVLSGTAYAAEQYLGIGLWFL